MTTGSKSKKLSASSRHHNIILCSVIRRDMKATMGCRRRFLSYVPLSLSETVRPYASCPYLATQLVPTADDYVQDATFYLDGRLRMAKSASGYSLGTYNDPTIENPSTPPFGQLFTRSVTGTLHVSLCALLVMDVQKRHRCTKPRSRLISTWRVR